MNYIKFTGLALLSAGVDSPILGMASEKGDGTSSKPNIILIFADDLGWGDVAFNGNREVLTPNMDKMVEDGVRFENVIRLSTLNIRPFPNFTI